MIVDRMVVTKAYQGSAPLNNEHRFVDPIRGRFKQPVTAPCVYTKNAYKARFRSIPAGS
jgi:hypothetical protein